MKIGLSISRLKHISTFAIIALWFCYYNISIGFRLVSIEVLSS